MHAHLIAHTGKLMAGFLLDPSTGQIAWGPENFWNKMGMAGPKSLRALLGLACIFWPI